MVKRSGRNTNKAEKGMKGSGKKYLLILAGLVLVGGVILASQWRKPSSADAAGIPAKTSATLASAPLAPAGPALDDAALRQKVIKYVRERFGMPPGVAITVDSFRPSIHPDFEETTLHTDTGKKQADSSVFVTKDQKWLVLGKLVAVKADPKAELIEDLREQFKVPATVNMTATDFHPSSYPNLLSAVVTLRQGNNPPQSQEFFLTSDHRALVVGGIFSLTQDLRKTALTAIDTVNQPQSGPARAPVTIVEYSDLQCPMCARMHDFLAHDVLKKYAGQVRVIFKEFPLTRIHDWTLTASLASQCVYEINPSAFLPFRSLVFENQTGINAGNVRDLMLSYGEQVGIDRLRLAGCVDSKASLPRVEAGLMEGRKIGVQSTPTSFINGRRVVGFPGAEEYHQLIDEALRAQARK